MEKILCAKEMAVPTLRTLESLSSWSVCHLFEHGINLMNGTQLLFLGEEGRPLCPFGMNFSKEDLRLIQGRTQENSAFTVRDGMLCSSEMKLCYSSAVQSDLRQKEMKIDSEISEWYVRVLQRILGLQWWGREWQEQAFEQRETDTVRRELGGLIGRGEGLTPSGDDFLIGVLWVDAVYDFLNEAFVGALKKLICAEEPLTTRVSLNYYCCAFERQFTSCFLELAQALARRSKSEALTTTAQILGLGHTSGRDTLSGIHCGMDAWQKSYRGNHRKAVDKYFL